MIDIVVFGLNRNHELALPRFASLKLGLGVELGSIHGGFLLPSAPVNNPRSGELNVQPVAFDSAAWLPFLNGFYEQMRQESIEGCLESPGLERVKKSSLLSYDIYENSGSSVINYIKYLYCSALFARSIQCYSNENLVLLVRPDLLLEFSASDLMQIVSKIKKNGHKNIAIATPSFHRFSWINDRLVVSSWPNIIKYMNRISYLNRYLSMPWRYFHAEKFTNYAIGKFLPGARLYYEDSLRVSRLRPGGRVEQEDFEPEKLLDLIRYRKFFAMHALKCISAKVLA